MEPSRYAELLRADSHRLVAVARDRLDAAVPSCPGWVVRDLVEHVAMVYDHKVACMRELRRPDPWPPEPPAGDPVDWLATSRDQLLAELETRGPDAPSFTWYGPDQTVGFWFRRMAQETAVHRLDAELAVGTPTPIATDLAVDGVDEVLHLMLVDDDWSDVPLPGPTRWLRVDCGERAWLVELAPTVVTVTDTPTTPGDTTVSGEPADVLLWLWGRAPDESVTVTGDTTAATALRERLVAATQ